MLKIAWRNLWRNKRRTLITAASVFFAVLFCLALRSFGLGAWNSVTEAMLQAQAGQIEVHQLGYWNDKIIDNFMTMNSDEFHKIANIQHVTNVAPRIETFSMASSEKSSKGVGITGIDPANEDKKSHLASKLVAGKYLTQTDDGILLGKGLSEYLRVGVGDSLAMMGQGYHGASAIGLFPIRGIVSLPMPDMDNNLIYMTISAAQNYISMPDGYSGLLISIDNEKNLDKTISAIQSQLDGKQYEVLSWKITMSRLLSQAQSDQAFSKMLMFLLYLLVGFGILGTVIMLTNERRREFAMMISLGMRRSKLALIMILELLLIALLGVAASMLVCVPIIVFYSRHAITFGGSMGQMMLDYGMPPNFNTYAGADLFTTQAVIVLLIVCIVMIYPVRKILKLKVSESLHE